MATKKKTNTKKSEKSTSKGRKARRVDLDMVRKCASQFQTQEEIARNCGFSPTYWCDLKKRKPEIQEAINEGRDNGRIFIKGQFFRLLEAGNSTAIIFALKVHCGWSEASDKVIEDKIDRVADRLISKNVELWNLKTQRDKI